MAYAQTAYTQVQGINGKYTIHDIGCFLTSFCNLLTYRYSKSVTPIELNNYFIAHKTYIDVDDGVRDDLAYGSITAFDGQIVVSRLVDHGHAHTAGLPSTRNAIVKFYYKSLVTGKFTTHFCLYDGGGYIIDSWDGIRKTISSTNYGQPVAFAEYMRVVPQKVTTPDEGDEMIATTAEAQSMYALLRPNAKPSDAEIKQTAGKRTYKQFLGDATNERKQRDANLKAQAAKLADQAGLIAQLQVTIKQLQSQDNTDKAAAAQQIAELTTQLQTATAQLGQLQSQAATSTPAPATQVIKSATANPAKPGLVVRVIAAMLRTGSKSS